MGPYDGFLSTGAVLKQGAKYYVVKNAVPTFFTLPGASVAVYATPTGKKEELAIGRGRMAEVFQLADRETYADDRKAHKKEISKARAAHKKARAEYARQLAENRRAIAEHDKRLGNAERSRQEALQRVRALSGQLVEASKRVLTELPRP